MQAVLDSPIAADDRPEMSGELSQGCDVEADIVLDLAVNLARLRP
jgi:hypothetical protein